jgi:hypothetical protein
MAHPMSVRKKHCLVLNEYNSFAMKDNELVRDMYSRLNLIINELNSIGINKLGDAGIVRKIISLLPQQRYGSIINILHSMEDLSTMTPTIVIRKIAAEKERMLRMWGEGPLQGQLSKYGGTQKGEEQRHVKTWDDSSSEDEPPRMHNHRSSSRSSRSSHKCLMARDKMSIPSFSDDSSSDDEGEGKPSVDELAEAVNFFQDVCTKQKAQLKTLKNKLISSQNDYKGLLEKFEIFANLNFELSTKIEQLESSAPSTAIDDGLTKKNEKLKAKLASSQEAIENLLGKMEIHSIHNDELTTKLENICWGPSPSEGPQKHN